MSGPNFPYTALSADQVLRQAFDETTDRLRVDSTATIVVPPGGLEINVQHTSDSIRLGDGTNYFTSTTALGKVALDVNMINALDVLIDASSDSIRLGDGSNLTTLTQNGLKYGLDVNIINTTLNVSDANALIELQSINSKLTSPISVSGPLTDAELRASPVIVSLPGVATELTLSSINSKLNTLGQKTSANSMPVVLASDQVITVDANLEAFSVTPDNVLMVGSLDGTKTGTKYGIVYNLRQQVLDSHDRNADFTYADFGTKNERITRIDYTSATFPGTTIRRDFNYTLVSGNYRRDDEVWSVI